MNDTTPQTRPHAPETFDNTRTKVRILREWYSGYPIDLGYERVCNKAQNETERRTLIDRFNRGEIGFIGNGHFNADGVGFVPNMPDVPMNPNRMRERTVYSRINKLDQLVGNGLLDVPRHKEWIKRLYARNVMGLSSEQYRSNPMLAEMPPPNIQAV